MHQLTAHGKRAFVKKAHQGFSLMELMVTVSIVGILAAIAYPSYIKQTLRSHRTEAKNALLQIQVAQEKYFLSNNTYGALASLSVPGLVVSGTEYYTTNSYYKIDFSTTPSTTLYTARAVAQGGQQNDTGCTTLTIDQTGTKGPTTGSCWTR